MTEKYEMLITTYSRDDYGIVRAVIAASEYSVPQTEFVLPEMKVIYVASKPSLRRNGKEKGEWSPPHSMTTATV